MLDKDAKNYHVWSYRQWLVKKFDLWDAGELQECVRFLNHDIRNNSAWNHRWFVVFGKLENQHITSELFDREIKSVTANARPDLAAKLEHSSNSCVDLPKTLSEEHRKTRVLGTTCAVSCGGRTSRGRPLRTLHSSSLRWTSPSVSARRMLWTCWPKCTPPMRRRRNRHGPRSTFSPQSMILFVQTTGIIGRPSSLLREVPRRPTNSFTFCPRWRVRRSTIL